MKKKKQSKLPKDLALDSGVEQKMKDLQRAAGIKVDINPDAMEPHEYFKILKTKKQDAYEEALQTQLNAVASYIIKAKELGQKSLLEKLSFTYEVIIKEQKLLAHGVKTFVYQKDVKAYLDKADNLRIIELSRYPRFIPVENMEAIKKVQDLGIFEDFCIVFTDYSEDDYKTEAEKAKVARNRDPIVFGHFQHKETGIKHDRLYFITDWEDEECDLTFPDLIKKMADAGFKDADHQLATDNAYINEIIRSTMDDMSKPMSHSFAISRVDEPKSFWERLKIWKK
jgi:signal recognition particle subunit SEC65